MSEPIADANPLTSPYTDCVVYCYDFETYQDQDEIAGHWQWVRLAKCDLCRDEMLDLEDIRAAHSDIPHCGHCGEKVSDHLSTEDPCRDSEQVRAVNAEDDFLARGA